MATVLEWQTLPHGPEKYQAYLASREWAVIKVAVRQRSGGVCEWCKHDPATQCHHQTYARQYREDLKDLLDVCGPCHRFLSGKSKEDPREYWRERPPEKPYRFVFTRETGHGPEVECPGCHGDWNCVHLQMTTGIESSAKYDVLTIPFYCECGCQFSWTITSGKGCTHIDSQVTGDSRPR